LQISTPSAPFLFSSAEKDSFGIKIRAYFPNGVPRVNFRRSRVLIKEKQAAIGKILRREMPRSFTERADEIKKSSRLFPRQS
jgi:hypothetical protein